MSKKRVVVSLGHDALGYTTTEQWDAVKVTAKALADLVEADYQLTITHSNGPWAVVSPDCIRPVVNPQTPGRIGHCKLLF